MDVRKMRDAYILARKSEGKSPLGRPRRKLKIILKYILVYDGSGFI
jgi:hypothetical protein